ncbi:MalY/PatB family protein [Clostridium omnivorum]|uniref:cysteine-S-conjugate beta-lyase n=1 Tax=Clostridium omnivorum TaxID=1604902 RepID=A0ABQ5N107_9CLOT|nr:MalY/PatB family protein [Clostridium sp. E14]GLC28863.1 cystathionine beta-lyase [Clostridium sp. E14]
MGGNFDKITKRKNTKSVKWDLKSEDILPMWVADMDFEVAFAIADAIKKRAEHPVYGYTMAGEEYYEAICSWWRKRHNFDIYKEWICYSPGVVPAINMLIKAFTKQGDKVMMGVPVYHPFFEAIKNNGCNLIQSELKYENGSYSMDFHDIEDKMKSENIKLFILCSPHNPVGRVWTKEELTRLGDLCVKYNVLIISDEIHCDLVYKGYKHIPIASICKEYSDITATCVAPSKTFNIAGLQTASVIIANEELRAKFNSVLESNGLMGPNMFGIEATEAAYKYGEPWLDELLIYLQNNLNYLLEYMNEKMPRLRVVVPQGTYLVWVDFSDYGLNSTELHERLLEKGKVWFNEGYIFGDAGKNFERINIACPREVLIEGLHRIEKALEGI